MITQELTTAIRENMSIDWNLRDSARAKMRITVRRLLKKYNYPSDLQKLAVEAGGIDCWWDGFIRIV